MSLQTAVTNLAFLVLVEAHGHAPLHPKACSFSRFGHPRTQGLLG